jgi:hypothetical protein
MRLILNFARSIALANTLALVVACTTAEPAGEFSTALGKLVRSEKVHEVNLSNVLPLVWDELFSFGPYSTRESNCRTLRLDWLNCRIKLPAEINDANFVLVFRSKSEIVHVEHHQRWNGDFSSLTSQRPQPILKSAAKFSVRLVSNRAPEGEQWYQLEHQDQYLQQ